MGTTTNTKPASDKQRAFAQKLNGERLVPDAGRSPAEATLWERNFDLVFDPSKFVSTREASAVIDWLLGLPRKPLEADAEQPEIGVYVLADGTLVQAKANKAKTNVYTKVWVSINGQRLTLADTRQHGEWEYAPALKASIRPELKMTAEQAKEFTLVYGQCARCGRRLKAAESVEQGIGPVCRQYFGF